MRALLLDAAPADHPVARAASDAVAAALAARGATVDRRVLRDVPLAWCQGCFECWTHHPGTCKIDDAGRDITEAFATSDLVVAVTPVVCGGYHALLKQAQDRLLGVILPFFRYVDGEVHHLQRYDERPAFGVLGVLDAPDSGEEATFRTLVERNGVNLASPACVADVVDRPVPPEALAAHAVRLVDALLVRDGSRQPLVREVARQLPDLPLAADGAPPRRAMLLVGSAKPTNGSTSEVLGRALLARLEGAGVATTVHHVHREAHRAERLTELVQAVRAHDLLVVAAPVYFDAWPALVVRVFEALLADRHGPDAPPLTLAGILNCGFPEAQHTAAATAMLGHLARRVGARWAGALALGGGGVINGRPLDAAGGIVRHVGPLLEQAADALAAGRAIPEAVQAALAKPLMPTLAYVVAGDAGWLWTASHQHALTRLWERPYQRPGTPGDVPLA